MVKVTQVKVNNVDQSTSSIGLSRFTAACKYDDLCRGLIEDSALMTLATTLATSVTLNFDFCKSCTKQPSVHHFSYLFYPFSFLLLVLLLSCLHDMPPIIVFDWISRKMRRKIRFSFSLMTRKCR